VAAEAAAFTAAVNTDKDAHGIALACPFSIGVRSTHYRLAALLAGRFEKRSNHYNVHETYP